VDWGQFGKYELQVDVATKVIRSNGALWRLNVHCLALQTMQGSVQGKADQWRKASFLRQRPRLPLLARTWPHSCCPRNLSVAVVAPEEVHDDSGHDNGDHSNCTHDH
jgi:hypothetical protein